MDIKKLLRLLFVFTFLFSSTVQLNVIKVHAADNQTMSPVIDNFQDYILDEENGNIYVSSENKLTILNEEDLKVKKEISIEGIMIDYDFDLGSLYVLDTNHTVTVINTSSLQVLKTIKLNFIDVTTNQMAYDIAVDNGVIYYSKSHNSSYVAYSLYMYNISNEKSEELTTIGKYTDPLLVMDKENDVLYVADGYNGVLDAFELSNLSKITSANLEDLNISDSYTLFFNQGEVFYSGYSFDGSDLTRVNGTYDGQIFSLNNNFVVTEDGIYNRNTFTKIIDAGYVIINSSSANIYYYSLENNRVNKVNLYDVYQAGEDHYNNNNQIYFLSDLTDWVFDNENRMIYAISKEANMLYFIDADNFGVSKQISVGSNPTDIELNNGKLYVALSGASKVAVIDANLYRMVDDIELGVFPYKLKATNDKLFYISDYPNLKLNVYDVENQASETLVDELYNSNVVLDKDNQLLYVGQFYPNNSKIYAIHTTDLSIDTQEINITTSDLSLPNEPSLEAADVHLLEKHRNELFVGKHVLDVNNLNTSYGKVNVENQEESIIYITDDYIVTNKNVYDRNSLEKVQALPYEITSIEMDASGKVYTFKKDDYSLIRYQSLNQFLSDWDYLDEDKRPEVPVNLTKYFATDINQHWAREYLADFLTADIINGYRDEEGNVLVKPDQSITRAEFVTILVRALGLSGEENATDFTDVKTSNWYYHNVRIANSNGIVHGVSDREFAPNQPIKRDEIATMVVRAFNSTINFVGEPKEFNDVSNYWAKEYIDKASSVGIVNGATKTSFNPKANAKRAEAMVMLYRALHLEKNNLPNDQSLIDLVMNQEKEASNAYTNRNFGQLASINDKYYAGYYKAHAEFNLLYSKTAAENGLELMDSYLDDELSAEVVEKTDRFAVVNLKGAVYVSEYKKGDLIKKNRQDSSGTLYLRKLSTGEWKIYNVHLPNITDIDLVANK